MLSEDENEGDKQSQRVVNIERHFEKSVYTGDTESSISLDQRTSIGYELNTTTSSNDGDHSISIQTIIGANSTTEAKANASNHENSVYTTITAHALTGVDASTNITAGRHGAIAKEDLLVGAGVKTGALIGADTSYLGGTASGSVLVGPLVSFGAGAGLTMKDGVINAQISGQIAAGCGAGADLHIKVDTKNISLDVKNMLIYTGNTAQNVMDNIHDDITGTTYATKLSATYVEKNVIEVLGSMTDDIILNKHKEL